MRYIFALFISLQLSAVDVTLSKDTNLSVKPIELEVVKEAYANSSATLHMDKLTKHLYENRVLSNIYLERNTPLSPKESVKIKHLIERTLATKVVQEIEEETRLTPEVIKSYYIAHQKDYQYEPTYDFRYISFKTFEEASDFYLKHKDDVAEILESDHNLTVYRFEKQPKSRVYYTILEHSLKHKMPFVLAPQKIENYEVIYVTQRHSPLPVPFAQVKNQIIDILINKEIALKKENILRTYKKEHK